MVSAFTTHAWFRCCQYYQRCQILQYMPVAVVAIVVDTIAGTGTGFHNTCLLMSAAVTINATNFHNAIDAVVVNAC